MSGPRRDHHDPGGHPVINFNVGTVHGPNYNVVGDVYIGATRVPAREIPQRLRNGLRHAALTDPDAREARGCVDDIDDALQEDRPDRRRVARALGRLTRLLSTTGTLLAAGAALIDPVTGLAVWLGTLGESILAELPTA